MNWFIWEVIYESTVSTSAFSMIDVGSKWSWRCLDGVSILHIVKGGEWREWEGRIGWWEYGSWEVYLRVDQILQTLRRTSKNMYPSRLCCSCVCPFECSGSRCRRPIDWIRYTNNRSRLSRFKFDRVLSASGGCRASVYDHSASG